jgi:hypothetical protein
MNELAVLEPDELATEPAPATDAPHAGPVWGCYPRLVTIEGTAGPCLAVVVVPEHPQARELFERLFARGGTDSCRNTLEAVRSDYFATGNGAKLREQEARLAETERDHQATLTTIDTTREQWRAVVATDSAGDVEKIEKAIEKHEANGRRLEARRNVLAEDVARLRQECANELYALLCAKRHECEEQAEAGVGTAKLGIEAALNAAFGAWVTAELELGGCQLDGHKLRLLASSEPTPPRTLKYAKPGTLPELEPAPPREREKVNDVPPFALGTSPKHRDPNAIPVGGKLVRMPDGFPMLQMPDGSFVDPPKAAVAVATG